MMTNRKTIAERAFTLIEVMVAMVAFAIILAAVNGIFWGALRLRNKTEEAIDKQLPVEHALAVIRNDLASIVPPGGTFAGEFQSTIVSNNTMSLLPVAMQQQGMSSPQFYTSSGVVDDSTYWSDVQLVSYRLDAPTNRNSIGQDLYRTVTRNLTPVAQLTQYDQESRSILSGVRTLNFYYSDGTTWKETWDSTMETYKLPKAVKVQIAMASASRGRSAEAPLEIVVPLIDAGTNNFTQTTQ